MGISNRFFVTALDDGSTLHGNLSADRSLSQAKIGSACDPDWTEADEQPTIFLTLLSGSTLVNPSTLSNIKWYYNGDEIVFNGSNVSTSPSAVAGCFQKTTYSVTYGDNTYSMPALKIIGNLATSTNVDSDIIRFSASYDNNGSSLAFEASTQIRITSTAAGGYLGLINFVNGIADITSKGQQITLWAKLYGGNNGGVVDTFTVTWYINDVAIQAGDSRLTTYTSGGKSYPALIVKEEDVVDHATISCDFKVSNESKYVAYVGVDDMQDPEFMYIQYNGTNGNAASLKKDETAPFQIWIGTRDNSNVLLDDNNNVAYNFIYVKLLNGDGNVVTTSGLATNIPNVANSTLQPSAAGYGYRKLPMSSGKGSLTPHYNTVVGLGKNMTGILMAYTTKPSWDTSQ